MGEARALAPLRRAEYLDWEAQQAEKHEYLAGEVFAMVGVRLEHGVVAGELYARLRTHLRDTRCRAFVSDIKLFVAAADAYFYPDVMVTCDERDHRAELAVEHPLLVIEVLSESTAAFDRGAKFAAYRKLDELVEYLLVDIPARRLELYRRAGDHWKLFEASAGDAALKLESVDLELSVEDVFADLDRLAAP